MGERGRRHCGFHELIVDLAEFKRKEQDVRARRGDAMPNIAKKKLGAERVGRIAAADKVGE
jgi:hypothetical protein